MNKIMLRCQLIALVFGVLVGGSFAYAQEAQQLVITSAENRTPLLELYTSEGCSSCPPADDYIRQIGQSLTADFNAVLLAFHVDYWNYLGWVDVYSQAAFTKRQKRVAANNRQSSIYTPQLVVDGRSARAGKRIVRAISQANLQPAEASIVVRVVADNATSIHAQLEVHNRAPMAEAYLAIFENRITRTIGGGENRGKTLKHDFVVRHLSPAIMIANGHNQADLQIEIPADWQRRNLGLAIIVLDRTSGATVQSVQAPLATLFAG